MTAPGYLHAHVRRLRRRVGGQGGDAGQVTAFVTILIVALLAVAGVVLDTGRALSAKTEALDQAEAAARAGAQQLDLTAYRTRNQAHLDPARAQAAAQAWITRAHLDGQATATTTTVTVTVHAASPCQLLTLVGVRDLHVSATATATPRRGITGPQP